jgi:hypothetical protein
MNINNIVLLTALCLVAYFSFEAQANDKKATSTTISALQKLPIVLELKDKAEKKIIKAVDIDLKNVEVLGVLGMVYNQEINTKHIKYGIRYEELTIRPDFLHKFKNKESRSSLNISLPF